MKISPENRQEQEVNVEERVYEAPAVIYEGKISTRAGSPTSVDDGASGHVIDPSDLFGN